MNLHEFGASVALSIKRAQQAAQMPATAGIPELDIAHAQNALAAHDKLYQQNMAAVASGKAQPWSDAQIAKRTLHLGTISNPAAKPTEFQRVMRAKYNGVRPIYSGTPAAPATVAGASPPIQLPGR